MSVVRRCDYCDHLAVIERDDDTWGSTLPGHWYALERNEGLTRQDILGKVQRCETRREFCSVECVTGWLKDRDRLANVQNGAKA